ncbi:TorD/DmsD family molecular chaperone [Desulfonatronum thioautotrophicum]|uniref:TorD/DmsD family molecular chaperone n=1 Tax=Desulfonatronum thioautotrophicum TaxID=617001 RepID=UPI00069C1CFD|nr:molecular chaperone TorD family protein [Desulfonatronum thioautotrophicum]
MNDHDHHLLLRGLESLAWVFQGAAGGQWSEVRTVCLPKMAAVLLALESRNLVDEVVMNMAEEVHALAETKNPLLSPESLEQEYVRLFVNHRDGLSVPLCQSCYTGEGRMMGEPALAMQSRLDQAGLRVDTSMPMPPDHLAIELAYLMVLFPEPDPLPRNSPTDNSQGKETPATFAAKTLLPWVGTVRRRLVEAEASPLFRLAGELLVALISVIAEKNISFSEQHA